MKGPEILILEKEPTVVLQLQAQLQSMGYNSIWACNWRGALACCREHWPDYAILNFRLQPGFDGMQLARILRVEYEMEILFITGARPEEVLLSPEYCPLHELLYKPYTEQQLRKTLEHFLRKLPT